MDLILISPQILMLLYPISLNKVLVHLYCSSMGAGGGVLKVWKLAKRGNVRRRKSPELQPNIEKLGKLK